MAIVAQVFIDFYDDQHRRATLEFYCTPPASLGAGVDLPTEAHIINLIEAIIGSTGVAEGKVIEYGVKVSQVDMSGITTQGSGAISMTQAFKTRSGVGLVGRVDPFGDQEGIELRIPAADISEVIFDPANRNAINTSGANWRAIATALVALGFQDSGGTVLTGGAVLEVATFFDGKRAPMRPR
jgi:hypothetical protein